MNYQWNLQKQGYFKLLDSLELRHRERRKCCRRIKHEENNTRNKIKVTFD